MHTHKHAHTHAREHTRAHTHMHTHAHEHTHTPCTHTQIHTYMHTRAREHTHTQFSIKWAGVQLGGKTGQLRITLKESNSTSSEYPIYATDVPTSISMISELSYTVCSY